MTTNTKSAFAIVAGIAFPLHRIIKGAFNSYHKTRLINKGADQGEVTPEGVKFFTARPRLEADQLKAEVESRKYKLVTIPALGFQWAVNAQGQYWIAGQGAVGQTLFANAIAYLTQAAKAKQAEEKKNKTTAKEKPAVTAKVEADKPKVNKPKPVQHIHVKTA